MPSPGINFANATRNLPIMKPLIGILLTLAVSAGSLKAQKTTDSDPVAFKGGEQLKYVVHFGFIDGGVAALYLKELDMNGRKILHAKCTGKSIGMASALFKVKDVYESFIDAETYLPVKAIRNISEDSYKFYDEVLFNRKENIVISDRKGKVKVPENCMDILGAFYYARQKSFSGLKSGDVITMETFFDDRVFTLQIRYKGLETIKTKFGKVSCLKFSPVVEPGRIFDSPDDVTIWISNDRNFLPMRVQFDLLVGSIKCDLVEYSGLANNFAVGK